MNKLVGFITKLITYSGVIFCPRCKTENWAEDDVCRACHSPLNKGKPKMNSFLDSLLIFIVIILVAISFAYFFSTLIKDCVLYCLF